MTTILILVTLGVIAITNMGKTSSSPLSGQSPTSTPVFPIDVSGIVTSSIWLGGTPMSPPPTAEAVLPVYTSSEAIELALQRLPAGVEPTLIETRLVTAADFFQQFHGLAPGMNDQGIGPLWVVGILAPGLMADDVFPPMSEIEAESRTPTQVEGGYFAWDANAGTLTAWGELTLTGDTSSMEAIQALENKQLPIATATAIPNWNGL